MKEYENNQPKNETNELLHGIASTMQHISDTLELIAINQLRIYDTLLSHYSETNHTDATKLAKTHKQGKLRTELPWIDQ